VSVKDWAEINEPVAKDVMTTVFYNRFTVTVGIVLIPVPDALIEVIVAERVIAEGNIISSHPVDDNLSFRFIENT